MHICLGFPVRLVRVVKADEEIQAVWNEEEGELQHAPEVHEGQDDVNEQEVAEDLRTYLRTYLTPNSPSLPLRRPAPRGGA